MAIGIFNNQTGHRHRRSIRLKDYDYSQPGKYFITVCIHDKRKQLFGEVTIGRMIENKIADTVRIWWNKIPDHFPNIALDEFIIMPNHIHGIIVIRDPVGAGSSRPNLPEPSGLHKSIEIYEYSEVGMNGHDGCHCNDRDDRDNNGRDDRAPLGMIMGYFKYQTIKQINTLCNTGIRKIWQRNYYDHIIRDQKSLFFIRNYIRNNPAAWEIDRENHLKKEIEKMHPGNR